MSVRRGPQTLGKLLVLGITACRIAAAALTFPAPPFTLPDLLRQIDATGARTIEALLPTLPNTLRENVTFLLDSASLQSSTAARPRAVIWNETGGLVLAFNGGDATETGSDTMEILSVDPRSGEPRFYELEFPLTAARAADALRAPATCRRCHGDSPRPIWQEYPTWDRSFGGQDDFSAGEQRRNIRPSPRRRRRASPATRRYCRRLPPPSFTRATRTVPTPSTMRNACRPAWLTGRTCGSGCS
jgi:hypothetical protein